MHKPKAVLLFLAALTGLLALATANAAAPATTNSAGLNKLVEQRLVIAQKVRNQYARLARELQISDLRPVSPDVGLFQRFELQFAIDGTFDNPFDPDQIQVDAQITRPDGSVVIVPAFFMQPFEPVDGQTRLEGEVLYRDGGQPGWRLRYSPTQLGEHQVVLMARQGQPSMAAQSGAIRFSATDSPHQGFVQVSKRNPQYFEFSKSGDLFYATGGNVPWTRTKSKEPELGTPDGTYEKYFGHAKGQMSATRVWQCHFAWIEWMPKVGEPANSSWSGYGGLGYYNQMVAAAFDRVFQMGEDADFRIMLVLDDNDEHMTPNPSQHQWWGNPHNVINGGPCEKPQQIYTDAAARKAYRNRLRYIIARWGYSPSLWAINTWNDQSTPGPDVLTWLREMHDHVHTLASSWRPIIFGTNYAFEAQAISDYAQAKTAGLVEGKPNVVQEAYYTRQREWFIDTLKLEIWKNMARGCGGVMVWPHATIDLHDGWKHFASVLRFVDGVKLNERQFKPIQARVTSATVDGTSATRVLAASSYGDIPQWGVRASEEHFTIDASAGSQFLMGMCPKLYGLKKDRKDWRTEPTFTFDLPGDGSFIVDVGELAGDDMKLVATDEGKAPLVLNIEGTGRRTPPQDQRFLRIPLAAGSHKLRISLEGGPSSDWLAIRKLMLVYEETESTRLLDLYGISSARQAVLYLRNSTCGELPEGALGLQPVKMRDVQLEIAGLVDGSYDVVLYSVDDGREISREQANVAGGKCGVRIPEIDRHIAVKVLGK